MTKSSNVQEEIVEFPVSLQRLEGVDRAMVELFRERLNVLISDDGGTRDFTVIMATGERWAMVRDRKVPRDANGALILPIITVRRTAIDRRVPPSQAVVANESPHITVVRRINRKTALLRNSVENRPFPRNNQQQVAPIYDIQTIPHPDPIRVVYDVKIWTQYQTHMNIILEKVFNNFDYGDTFKLNMADGFYCVAQLDPNIASQDNFEEFTDDERIIRYTMTYTANVSLVLNPDSDTTYTHADIGGTGKSVKRILQTPAQIKFAVKEGVASEAEIVEILEGLNVNSRLKARLLNTPR